MHMPKACFSPEYSPGEHYIDVSDFRIVAERKGLSRLCQIPNKLSYFNMLRSKMIVHHAQWMVNWSNPISRQSMEPSAAILSHVGRLET